MVDIKGSRIGVKGTGRVRSYGWSAAVWEGLLHVRCTLGKHALLLRWLIVIHRLLLLMVPVPGIDAPSSLAQTGVWRVELILLMVHGSSKLGRNVIRDADVARINHRMALPPLKLSPLSLPLRLCASPIKLAASLFPEHVRGAHGRVVRCADTVLSLHALQGDAG